MLFIIVAIAWSSEPVKHSTVQYVHSHSPVAMELWHFCLILLMTYFHVLVIKVMTLILDIDNQFSFIICDFHLNRRKYKIKRTKDFLEKICIFKFTWKCHQKHFIASSSFSIQWSQSLYERSVYYERLLYNTNSWVQPWVCLYNTTNANVEQRCIYHFTYARTCGMRRS